MQALMGIDLGTSSCKTLIMQPDGEVLSIAQKGYDIESSEPGFAEQNIDVLCDAAFETVRAAIEKSGLSAENIAGVGFSGQMHGLVLLDKQNKPIRNAIIWADQRSGPQIDEIYNTIPKDEFREITLNSPSTGFYICSLLWVREHEPELFKKINKAVLPKDYIRYRLCKKLSTDESDASSTLIFDVANRQWAWSLIDKLGLDRNIFPTCGKTCDVAGEVDEEAEELTGLKKGTPIVFGGGDQPMQAVGNGIIAPGIFASNIGTASQISCAAHSPLHDKYYRTNTFCHAEEDLWTVMGASLCGGIALKWLRNKIFKGYSYDDFDKLAEEVPAGSNGLIFLPYLGGERTPYNDPDAKGMFYGLTFNHDCRHMIRSVMEGITYSLRTSLEIVESMGLKAEKIIASGGGASCDVWLQIQADIFGRDIYTSNVTEQACIGAAICAGVGVKDYSSLRAGCNEAVHLNSRVVHPNEQNKKLYDKYFEIFSSLYPNNKELFKKSTAIL